MGDLVHLADDGRESTTRRAGSKARTAGRDTQAFVAVWAVLLVFNHGPARLGQRDCGFIQLLAVQLQMVQYKYMAPR